MELPMYCVMRIHTIRTAQLHTSGERIHTQRFLARRAHPRHSARAQNMPNSQLHFCGWHEPVLHQALAHLMADWHGGQLDLSHAVIIVPTAETARRLREALAVATAKQDGAVCAPHVWHPEMALSWGLEEGIAASSVQELLAWMQALACVKAKEVATLFPAMPAAPDAAWIRSTADTLCALARTLGAGAHTMASVAEALAGELDHARWLELAAVERLYLQALQRLGVTDRQEIKHRRALDPVLPDGVSEVCVFAVADLSPPVRQWLTNVAKRAIVKTFVHAPENQRGAFDEMGASRINAWNEDAKLETPLQNEALHIVPTPQDQASRAVSLLHEMGQRGMSIAIGACNPALNAQLAGALSVEDAHAFDPAGRAAEVHALTQVLRAWQRLMASGNWREAAAFLRMDDVLRAVCPTNDFSPARLLRLLDELHAEHLPPTLEDAIALARGDDFKPLRVVVEQMHAHFQAWEKESCTTATRELLAWIYGEREFATEHEQHRDYVKLLGEIMQLTAELDETANKLRTKTSSMELLSILLDELSSTRLADMRGDVDFVLQGWLELLWEPADGLVIAGFNEEHVPGIVTGDPFLPDALRGKLGLASQSSRRARDAYLLRAMAEQRRDHGALRIVLGRVNEQGDAQRPSRLLFDCADASLVARVRHLFPKENEAATEPEPPTATGFKLRPTHQNVTLKTISPSTINKYLACPFRFYLSNIQRMSQVDSAQREATPMAFGNHIHEALCGYADADAMRDCMDEKTIALWLDNTVVSIWRKQYGPRPLLSVEMQLESARQRLGATAEGLAKLRAEGWRTIHAEQKVKDWDYKIGGVPFSGKIDRVDQNGSAMRIWDYKTTGKLVKPCEAHFAKPNDGTPPWQCFTNAAGKPRRWVDVQLPLYVWALRQKYPDAQIRAGYFVLPATVTDTGTMIWEDLDDDTIADSVRCAEEAARRIQAGEFWPPAVDIKYDDYEELLLGDPVISVDGAALMERSAA